MSLYLWHKENKLSAFVDFSFTLILIWLLACCAKVLGSVFDAEKCSCEQIALAGRHSRKVQK